MDWSLITGAPLRSASARPEEARASGKVVDRPPQPASEMHTPTITRCLIMPGTRFGATNSVRRSVHQWHEVRYLHNLLLHPFWRESNADQFLALGCTHRRYQRAARNKLIQQRVRKRRGGGRDHDGIIRRVIRPTECAIRMVQSKIPKSGL